MRSLLLALTAGVALAVPSVKLPIVDLGYQRHQAVAYNSTGGYYNFSSIRYAQPPVGKLRFAAPVPPQTRSNKISKGAEGGNCPQAPPCWFEIQTEFVAANLSGKPFDFDKAVDEVYSSGECSEPLPKAKRDPLESEDCLFLDVHVPKPVFDKSSKKSGAPVLVYIFGGGYVAGSKTHAELAGDPAGLIKNSYASGTDGVIYVGINYRLGALGWMFGSTFAKSGGLLNAGLHDQRLALKWIQDNIHKFGGDPKRVTVMGESAGGGSILMQMTAYGGKAKAPFQQAITQSPAWEPGSAGKAKQEELYSKFLSLVNATNLEEARKASSEAVINANQKILRPVDYAITFFGPTIDGTFVPEDPKALLAKGKVDKSVGVLTTHATDEGLRFAPGNVTTAEDFRKYVAAFINSATPAEQRHIVDKVYPPVFDGSLPYKGHFGRASLLWAEFVSTCNTNYMLKGSAKRGYSNEFAVPPALHQGDIPYVFWNGPGTNPELNETVAALTQTYITQFTISGNPNRPGQPYFPSYDGKRDLKMAGDGIYMGVDATVNPRCAYWQKATYNGA